MSIKKYVVVPPIEGGLQTLRELAENFWYTWNIEAVELFNHLDEKLWEETNHNPLQTLIRLSQQRLNEVLQDEGFLAHAEKVRDTFRAYMRRTKSYDYRLDTPIDFITAYFSLEFGITESLPIYSGGLGLLAGDHLKSASDLNVPLAAVGLMYQEGYFRQSLSTDGRQQEYFPRTDFDTLPLEPQLDAEGRTILERVTLADETVYFRILKASVGRAPLYLLDANIPENPPPLRAITARLYGGDLEMRIRQEYLLGVGGCRALKALGLTPMVYHLNEGHAAFTLLERARFFIEEKGLTATEAVEMVTSQSVLTIHTPVPAGNDVFDRGLMEKYFRHKVERLGFNFDTFLGLGRRNPEDWNEGFWMPVLGLRMTARANGVSKIHGRVTREMWHEVWPNVETADVPIIPITNGVHIPSYISRDLARLYDRYLGPGWSEDPDNAKIWDRAEKIPDTELWRTHERCRARLVRFVRHRICERLRMRNAPEHEIEAAKNFLDPDALTICFARRFATYKRATLLFREPDRLAEILTAGDKPVQLIFAGKAHPADETGKEFIQKIIELSKDVRFRGRLAFIEDYDINVARHMVQGADVWLNNPRRPLEACGTSGMKAAANGALNLSVLDGWWDEAYNGANGWAIGSGEEYANPLYQDDIESLALYDLLEQSVKPLFYERGMDDMPREWITMMKRCIGTICPEFNAHRMVSDYVENCYIPAYRAAADLQRNNYAVLREMVSWKEHISKEWDRISIKDVEVGPQPAVKNHELDVKVTLDLAGHKPEEFRVVLLHGPIDTWEEFIVRHTTSLTPFTESASPSSNGAVFAGKAPLTHTGLYGYVVQVTAFHPNLPFSQSRFLVLRG